MSTARLRSSTQEISHRSARALSGAGPSMARQRRTSLAGTQATSPMMRSRSAMPTSLSASMNPMMTVSPTRPSHGRHRVAPMPRHISSIAAQARRAHACHRATSSPTGRSDDGVPPIGSHAPTRSLPRARRPCPERLNATSPESDITLVTAATLAQPVCSRPVAAPATSIR